MTGAVEPRAREVERRTWPVGETEHALIKMHGLSEFPRRYVVMVRSSTPTLIFIRLLLVLAHGSYRHRFALANQSSVIVSPRDHIEGDAVVFRRQGTIALQGRASPLRTFPRSLNAHFGRLPSRYHSLSLGAGFGLPSDHSVGLADSAAFIAVSF